MYVELNYTLNKLVLGTAVSVCMYIYIIIYL